MSVGGGRYCGIGDATVQQSRAGRLPNSLSSVHIPCDIGLGSEYSAHGCELKIESVRRGFVSHWVEMRMLSLQGQDCTRRLHAGLSTAQATGVQIPSGAAFHFDIILFPSRLELIRVPDNRCFEHDAEMTVRTARGLPLVVRMVLREEQILET